MGIDGVKVGPIETIDWQIDFETIFPPSTLRLTMNARDIVLEYFPQAESQYFKEVREYSQTNAIQSPYWGIYAASGLGQRLIASGPTEQAAWVEAAIVVLGNLKGSTGLLLKRETLDNAKSSPDIINAITELIKSTIARGEKVIVHELDGTESEVTGL